MTYLTDEELAALTASVQLRFHELKALRSLARAEAMKCGRRLAKKQYTPAPGKIDQNKARENLLLGLVVKLDAVLSAAKDSHAHAS